MEAFGKGQVYVNGHALGRFWQIGPQQTLYLPGCWLKKGKNEVIVLDVVGPKGEAGKPGSTVAPTAFCQDHPELDKLNLEKSNKHNEPGHRMDLNSETPVLKGEFKAGNGWQTIKLDKPVTGRYFAIQAESSQSGDSQIAIAEVYLQDAQATASTATTGWLTTLTARRVTQLSTRCSTSRKAPTGRPRRAPTSHIWESWIWVRRLPFQPSNICHVPSRGHRAASRALSSTLENRMTFCFFIH